VCRAIEPDLLSVAAGEAGFAAAGRVEAHLGTCQPCRDELACYRALEGMIDSLRRAPRADEDATLAPAQLAARLSDLRSRIPRRRKPRTSGRVRQRPLAQAAPARSGALDQVSPTSRTGRSGRLRGASQKEAFEATESDEGVGGIDMSTTPTARLLDSVDINTRVEAVDWASASAHLDSYG